jgi:hypothetical protein
MRKIFSFSLLRLRNAVDYPLRRFFRWRRGGFALDRQAKNDSFVHFPPEKRRLAEDTARVIGRNYHLDEFSRDSSAVNYQENLYYLQLLEEALNLSGASLPADIAAADIGPSHWFYVQALYALLRWWKFPSGRSVSLAGYEIDAYRVYTDFYSRFDHALAHMRGLPGVTYIPEGFTLQEGRFHLITMLFPFVFEQDHLYWGLPSSAFRPDHLLEHVWQSLHPGGVLIIVNQGEEEHQAQKQRLQNFQIPIIAAYRHDPLLFSYSIDRYVCVCRRDYEHR